MLSEQEAHAADRYFAVEANNQAWKLLESGAGKDPARVRDVVNAAHASAYHWERCGEPINALRSAYLLTSVMTAVGWSQSAMWHAQETHAMLLGLPDEVPLFDRAASLVALSQAYELAGKEEEAAVFLLDAESLAGGLEAEDRAVLRIYWGL